MLSSHPWCGRPAIVCRHVADGAPILFAARDELEGRRRAASGSSGAAPRPTARTTARSSRSRRWSGATRPRSRIVLHPRGTALERRRARTRAGTPRPGRCSSRTARRAAGLASSRSTRRAAASRSTRATCGSWPTWRRPGSTSSPAPPTAATPAFAFSVGLFRSFDHPEVAVFGLAAEVLEARACGGSASGSGAGERFDEGDVVDGLLDGRAVAFRPDRAAPLRGAASATRSGTTAARASRRSRRVWSEGGRFPWERWFPRALRDAQPVLFEPAKAA